MTTLLVDEAPVAEAWAEPAPTRPATVHKTSAPHSTVSETALSGVSPDEVSVRELRNNTAAVVDRVRAGEQIFLTSRGQRVARIVPVDSYLKPYMTREEFIAMPKADRGLLDDLKAMGSEETDTVGPLE